MPELPEVEFARRCLERWLGGRRLACVEVEPTRLLRDADPALFPSLSGRRVERIRRRGKWLLVETGGPASLLVHLGMTGKLVLRGPAEVVRWSRARLARDDGFVVHLQDMRMFGRLVAGPVEVLLRVAGWDALGPDALLEPLSGDALRARLAGRRGAVKDALLDQSVLAGLGNIQATEALFGARLHPARRADSLSPDEAERIVNAIHETLVRTLALDDGKDEITYVEDAGGANPFVVYGRSGTPCPRCGARLESATIGGRASVFCGVCQVNPSM